MKLQLFTLIGPLLLGFAAAGKLSSQYLPPSYAGSSGGHGGLLQGPEAFAQRPSNQYLAPQASNLHYHGVSGAGHSPRTSFAGAFSGAGAGAFSGAGAPGAPGGSTARYAHNNAAAQIPILRNDYTNDGSGNYRFGYETGNGIRHDETGELEGGWPHGSQSVAGSYSYTGDDGHVYTVNYKADSNGFHAEGDHLPTPPPIPPEIQQSLALHQSSGSTGGAYGGSPGGGDGAYRGGAGAGAYGRAGGSHGGAPGAHGGVGSHGAVGFGGGHHAAASAHAPTTSYLPPQQQGYQYGRRH